VTLAYALLAGARVPTVRAAIMISLYLLAIALNRRRDLLRSLAIAAVVVGLWRPGAVFDPSFGLSFVAVLSIAIGLARAPWAHGPRWREDVAPPEDSVPGGPSGWRLWAMSCGRKLLVSIGVWIATSAIVAIAAAVGTAPLTARYFNLVSIVGPLANLVAVPLFSAAVVAALLGTAATAAVPGLGSAAALPLDLAAALVSAGERLIAVAAAAQWAALRVATPSPLEVALCYALMACVLGWHHRLGRVGLVVTLLVIGGDAAYWVRERLARPDLRVTFLDVGQGDAAVVEFPGHRVLVVDGGGFPGGALDPGEAAVARYLWSRKILRIDYLAMSHADVDHAGGLGFIAEEFRPRQLWWTGRDAGDPGVERVRTALRAGEGTEIALTAAIPTWTVGRVAVEVLHPDASAVRVARRNDASLVFRLRWGESAVLFTGDIERLGEAHLLRRHPGTLASTVLKVPHHGSRTSSGDAFVDAVGAKVAVVSVGGGNRYRFPHPEVERRYERGGVCLRRTDRDGAVTVRIDGAGYAVDPPCSPTPSRSLAGVGR
jgi:competence protein ComEC